jgi:hypothetical protein
MKAPPITPAPDPRWPVAYAICAALYRDGCACEFTKKEPCDRMTLAACRAEEIIEKGRVSA